MAALVLAFQISHFPQPLYVLTFDRIISWLYIENPAARSLKRKRSEPSVMHLPTPSLFIDANDDKGFVLCTLSLLY